MSKLKVGDWVYKISSKQIRHDKFIESFGERGIFGRIIKIEKTYSSRNGTKKPDLYLLRIYTRNGRGHSTAMKKELNKIL